jgi:hypothetical protein
MIHEFAVEPELFVSWAQQRDVSAIIAKEFGVGTTRILSKFPADWSESVKSLARQPEVSGGLAMTRLTEYAKGMTSRLVRRASASYVREQSWATNAVKDHNRVQFAAIFARDGVGSRPIIGASDVFASNEWHRPRSRVVGRSLQSLVEALAPALRIASWVLFVDPHFGPENPRHRKPLGELLRAAAMNRPGAALERVMVLTGMKSTREFFERSCREELPKVLPKGQTVKLRRLRERTGGQKLHNRYVLTDFGGVSVATGLDTGPPTHTDDIGVLDHEQYMIRVNEYDGVSQAFEVPEPDLVLVGEAEVR